MTKTKIVVHSLLPARVIRNGKWKSLNEYFQSPPLDNGIYFYLYKNSNIPFNIGKCTSKSYTMLGRVYDELEDYVKGRYYLSKHPEQLEDLRCFKPDIAITDFFIPKDPEIGSPEFVTAVETFLDNTEIMFSFVMADTANDIQVVADVEAQMQRSLNKSMNLKPRWVGDGGAILSKSNPDSLIDLVFTYSHNVNRKLDETLLTII